MLWAICVVCIVIYGWEAPASGARLRIKKDLMEGYAWAEFWMNLGILKGGDEMGTVHSKNGVVFAKCLQLSSHFIVWLSAHSFNWNYSLQSYWCYFFLFFVSTSPVFPSNSLFSLPFTYVDIPYNRKEEGEKYFNQTKPSESWTLSVVIHTHSLLPHKRRETTGQVRSS